MQRFLIQLCGILIIGAVGAGIFWRTGLGTVKVQVVRSDGYPVARSNVPSQPVSAEKYSYFIHADVVRGARGAMGPVCVPNAVFHLGEEVVFRGTLTDASSSEPISSADVDQRSITMTVVVNGTLSLPMYFAPHPARSKTGHRTTYWVTAWPIPKTFPYEPVTWTMQEHDKYGDNVTFAPIGQDVGLVSITVAPLKLTSSSK